VRAPSYLLGNVHARYETLFRLIIHNETLVALRIPQDIPDFPFCSGSGRSNALLLEPTIDAERKGTILPKRGNNLQSHCLCCNLQKKDINVMTMKMS
jgi:hypothetical protein